MTNALLTRARLDGAIEPVGRRTSMRLYDTLDLHAREHPEAEFAVHGQRRLTYAEAAAETNRLAHALIDAGLQVGDRVAILAKNCLEYPILYYGCAKAGVVPVPLNYRLAPPEWVYILDDAGARALFAVGPYVEEAEALRGQVPSVERWVAIDAEGSDAGWDHYRLWLTEQPTSPPPRAASVTPTHDAIQLYTSGTTGPPKGAVLTHRNLLVAAPAWARRFAPEASGPRLVVLPYFHIGGTLSTFAAVQLG